MSKKTSGIWIIAMPASLVVLGAAYYIKVPKVRTAVDDRAPWVADILGRFVEEPEVKTIVIKQERPAAGPRPVGGIEAPKASVAKAEPKDEASPVVPKAAPEPVLYDLEKIAGDRSVWPKKVALTKPASFPAVLNGKVVGSLIAPAGSEATLVSIKDDKVGLEFQGGGAWLPADQTDLVARVQSAH
jgi:hypothetical protein